MTARAEHEELGGSHFQVKRPWRAIKRSRGVKPEAVAIPIETPATVALVTSLRRQPGVQSCPVSIRINDWDELKERVRAAIQEQPRGLQAAELRTAEWNEAARSSAAGTVDFLTEAEREATDPVAHVYPTLRLSRQVLRGKDIVDNVVADLGNRATAFRHAYWERDEQLTRDEIFEWPRWQLRVSVGDGQRPTTRPLLAFGEPPHSDATSAVSHWLGGDGWTPGEWRIRIPDLRGRFSSLHFSSDGVVHVAVDSVFAVSELEVQVLFDTSLARSVSRGRAPVNGAPVTITAPDGAEQASVFLVTRANEVLDRQHVRREALERTQAERLELEEQCRRDLAAGEDEHVELKPWITPRDAKENEVVRTIVAFANTHGGRLYVGVAATGAPQGRSELFKVFRAATGPQSAAAEEAARAWLRGLVQEKLRRRPNVAEQIVEVYGDPVLCVVVERGHECPYATIENEIVVRKGASNRRPDPYSELPDLLVPRAATVLSW